jgi:hypothetical protein
MNRLSYSEWRKINLKPKKQRHKKKFEKLYSDNHPDYLNYCLRLARAEDNKQGIKGLSSAKMAAYLAGTYTDVMLKKVVFQKNPLLELLPKDNSLEVGYMRLPLE